MKSKIQSILQKLLGYKRYLLIFSIYKYFTMRFDKRLEDFFYFLHIIPKEKAVLDIGANLGYMSLLFSKKIGKNKVIAFEPIKDNFSVMTNVIHLFGVKNIIPLNFALGDEEKNINMITPIIKGVKKQGLSQVVNNVQKDKRNLEAYKVQQKKLDSTSEISNLVIGAIKIDVEGYEHFVFKGGLSIINKNKPIIFCELWEKENFSKCNLLLKPLGYKIFYYKDAKLLPYEYDAPTNIINFFFIHEKRVHYFTGNSPS